MSNWRLQAECAEYEDPDAFFPAGNNERDQMRESITARTICAMCPVSDQCFTAAVQERDFYAVRGGTVPAQRRTSKRKYVAPPPRTADEALFLYQGGVHQEAVAQALKIKLASVERAIFRAGMKVPWPQTMSRHGERQTA